nr:reverse transcriptase domain-containing protein [Tanacetum cinerariifolium]
MDAIVVEDLTHHQSVMTNQWEDPKKKPTMHMEDIKEEDIKETTTKGILEIGAIIDQETITKTHNLMKITRQNEHMNVVFTQSGKTYDPPVNPNAKTTIVHDNSDEEEEEPTSSKKTYLIHHRSRKDQRNISRQRIRRIHGCYVKEILEQEEEVKDNFEELPLVKKLRIKTSIQEPPTDLEMKPFPKHLEYAFLEKDSILPVVISALLKDDKKKRLVSFLKITRERLLGKHLIFWALANLSKSSMGKKSNQGECMMSNDTGGAADTDSQDDMMVNREKCIDLEGWLPSSFNFWDFPGFLGKGFGFERESGDDY